MAGMLAGVMDRSLPNASEYASTASNNVQLADADVMAIDPSRHAGFHIGAGLRVCNIGAVGPRWQVPQFQSTGCRLAVRH
jgi:hypothetical protein